MAVPLWLNKKCSLNNCVQITSRIRGFWWGGIVITYTIGFTNGRRLFTEDLDFRDSTPNYGCRGKRQTTSGRHIKRLIEAPGHRLQNGLPSSCNCEYNVVSTLTTLI